MRALRQAGTAFAIALLLALGGAKNADAQRITIDVKPLAAKGPRGLGAAIRPSLHEHLRKALAGKYSGPVTVRIRGVTLANFTSWRIREPTDYMEGDAIIPGRAPIPILVALPFDGGYATFTPEGQARRMDNLIQSFAAWVARYI